MARKKQNYRIHNPNPAEITADHIWKVFMEVNEKKAERAMQEFIAAANHRITDDHVLNREECYEDSSILPCFHR